MTADFVALYSIDKQSQLKFSVENIFDKDYQSLWLYCARTYDQCRIDPEFLRLNRE